MGYNLYFYKYFKYKNKYLEYKNKNYSLFINLYGGTKCDIFNIENNQITFNYNEKNIIIDIDLKNNNIKITPNYVISIINEMQMIDIILFIFLIFYNITIFNNKKFKIYTKKNDIVIIYYIYQKDNDLYIINNKENKEILFIDYISQNCNIENIKNKKKEEIDRYIKKYAKKERNIIKINDYINYINYKLPKMIKENSKPKYNFLNIRKYDDQINKFSKLPTFSKSINKQNNNKYTGLMKR